MQYELYLDVLLLTDFSMNLMVLFLTGKFLKLPLQAGKIICAAFFGAVLHGVVLIAMIKTREQGLLITSPFNAAGMLTMAFAIRNRILFLKAFAAMIGVSAILSGLMQAANPLQKKTAVSFVLTVAGAYTVMMALDGFFRRLRRKQRNLYQVCLYFGERDLKVTGLLDTGNRLIDPIYKKPVHILDGSAVQNLIPELSGLAERSESPGASVWTEFLKRTESLQSLRLHLIPYHSIGKNRGLLPAIMIPRMVIIKEDGEQEIKEAVVAFTRERVSSDGCYQMILHEECIG